MAAHKERRLLFHEPEQIFDLVADVESYPDFLPLWRSATVRKSLTGSQGAWYHTEQVIQLGPARKRFRTRTELHRPHRIEVSSSDPLFRQFTILWQFEPKPGRACLVDFSLRCTARSPLLQPIFELVLMDAARSIVTAFESRAGEVYGKRAVIGS